MAQDVEMNKIIACIDHSAAAAAVCDAGAWVSRRTQRPLVLLHVLDQRLYPAKTDLSGNIGLGSRTQLLEELADLDRQRSKLALEQGQQDLATARERVAEQGITDPELLQRHGHFVETLQDLQDDTRVLVLGRQGEEHQGAAQEIGSNLERVIRTLACRILITPPDFKAPQKVLFAYDASPTAKKVLSIIARSPLFKGIPIHLLMIGEAGEKNLGLLHAARQELIEQGHTEVDTQLMQGPVEKTLLAYQQQQQLEMIIMGAYGHSRIREFFVGSTTTNLLRLSPVPILLMR